MSPLLGIYALMPVQVLDNEPVRFQAAYSGSLLGLEASLPVLKHFFFEKTPYLRTAIGLLYHVVNASEISDAVTRIQESKFSPRIKANNIAMAGLQLDRLSKNRKKIN